MHVDYGDAGVAACVEPCGGARGAETARKHHGIGAHVSQIGGRAAAVERGDE